MTRMIGVGAILPLLAHTLAAAAKYLALRRDLLRGPDTGIPQPDGTW